MKKIIIVVIILVIGFASIDPCANWYTDKGFEEKNPDKCLTGASIHQKIFRHRAAITTYTKMLRVFPNLTQEDEVRYNLAYCYEQTENYPKAMEEYSTFISKFPNHAKVKYAEKRLSSIKANSTNE